MRKTLLIIGIVIALINVIYSFFGMNETGTLFGFEMNIWVYRFIWLMMAALIFNAYRKESKSS